MAAAVTPEVELDQPLTRAATCWFCSRDAVAAIAGAPVCGPHRKLIGAIARDAGINLSRGRFRKFAVCACGRPIVQNHHRGRRKKVCPHCERERAPDPGFRHRKKPCARCGRLFQPTGARSEACPRCKRRPPSRRRSRVREFAAALGGAS